MRNRKVPQTAPDPCRACVVRPWSFAVTPSGPLAIEKFHRPATAIFPNQPAQEFESNTLTGGTPVLHAKVATALRCRAGNRPHKQIPQAWKPHQCEASALPRRDWNKMLADFFSNYLLKKSTLFL
jgi:hypothetical protein